MSEEVSRQTILRGCRTGYIPGLDVQTKDVLSGEPFADSTTKTGEDLMALLTDKRCER